MKKVVVTGGAGFIGSALVRFLIRETEHEVVNLDALTYAGNLANVAEVAEDPRYRFVKLDLRDATALGSIFAQTAPDAVIHLAAESHVDRSIDGPADFVHTNVLGTFHLLQAARAYHDGLHGEKRAGFRFHHVSTDEVFGSLEEDGAFSEVSPYAPNSPYAASKAASDHLVRAWNHTYGLPIVLTNCSNNFGPYQYPEKLIPLVINRALAGASLPVYGDGRQVRDWLYVEDHVRGLYAALMHGRIGESYNIGGVGACSNLDLVQQLCALLDRLAPRNDGRSYREQIAFVADRPGHDFRYAIDASKIRRELGWQARESLASGLEKAVRWYLANRDWCREALVKGHAGDRVGLAPVSAAAGSRRGGRR